MTDLYNILREIEKTNKLLSILTKVVIRTHDYEDLRDLKDELKRMD